MGLTKSLFAKPIPKSVRLMTALKITSKTYCRNRVNLPSVFFALHHNYDEKLTAHQMNAVCGTSFSRKTAYAMREFFIDVYNDEQLILDFLNGAISSRYFSQIKKTTNTEDATDAIMKNILSNNDVFGMLDDLKL